MICHDGGNGMKYRTICVTVALCLLLTVLAGCGDKSEGAPLFAKRGEAERAPLGDLLPAANAETVLAALSAAGQTHASGWDPGEPEDSQGGPQLESGAPAAGDTVATDGSCIYMLDSYGLIILSAAGTASERLSYTRVERPGNGWSERLYLAPDRAVIVCTGSDADGEDVWRDSAQVHITLLDTADKRNPRLLAETAVEGSWVDSCLIDGTLCIVTQRSFLSLPEEGDVLPCLWENDEELRLQPGDVYLCQNPSRAAVTVVASVRVEDGRVADALAFTDGTESVCVADDVLILSRTRWDETASAPYREEPYTVVDYTATARTELKRVRVENGGLTLDGGCVLEGALTDPAALELRNGILRAATQTDSRSFSAYTDEKHGWTNYEGRSHSRGDRLTLLDVDLNVTGLLTDLGGDHGVSACCFAGPLAWLRTAEDQALLYAANLSDSAAPAMTGSLPGRGETLSLRAFGAETVLGLAAPAEGEPWQLVVYDVHDPANPREADSLALSDWSPAAGLNDRGALFADPATGLIGFAAQGETGMRYLLVRWDGERLREQEAFALEYIPANVRGLLLNGLLYICGPGEVYVVDPDAMEVLATVSNAVG